MILFNTSQRWYLAKRMALCLDVFVGSLLRAKAQLVCNQLRVAVLDRSEQDSELAVYIHRLCCNG